MGGTALHWGTHARRFLPWDFETRSRTIERYGKSMIPEDCTSQDWGITYDELEPYYDQFEHLYGVGGKAGNLQRRDPARRQSVRRPALARVSEPAVAHDLRGHDVRQGLRGAGLQAVHVNPIAAQTQAYMNPYKLMLGQCIRGGFCTQPRLLAGREGQSAARP